MVCNSYLICGSAIRLYAKLEPTIDIPKACCSGRQTSIEQACSRKQQLQFIEQTFAGIVFRNCHFYATEYLYWCKESIQGTKKKPCSNSHPIFHTQSKQCVENNAEINVGLEVDQQSYIKWNIMAFYFWSTFWLHFSGQERYIARVLTLKIPKMQLQAFVQYDQL